MKTRARLGFALRRPSGPTENPSYVDRINYEEHRSEPLDFVGIVPMPAGIYPIRLIVFCKDESGVPIPGSGIDLNFEREPDARSNIRVTTAVKIFAPGKVIATVSIAGQAFPDALLLVLRES